MNRHTARNIIDRLINETGKPDTIEWKAEVSNNGVREINHILISNGHKAIDRVEFQLQYGWSTDNRNGRLTKRIAQYIYKKHGEKIDQSVVSMIGNTINDNSGNDEEITYDIVNKLWWKEGDFKEYNQSGNPNCYWSCNRDARPAIEYMGGCALRMYDENQQGAGRAWVIPVDDGILVFNGYGDIGSRKASARHYAAVLVEIIHDVLALDTNIFPIPAERGDSAIFVNNDVGYLITDSPSVSNYIMVDMDMYFQVPDVYWTDNSAVYLSREELVEQREDWIVKRDFENYDSRRIIHVDDLNPNANWDTDVDDDGVVYRTPRRERAYIDW